MDNIEKLKNIPTSLLSEITMPNSDKKDFAAIDKDFEETNKHTQDTLINEDKTETTDKTDKTVTKSGENNKSVGDYIKAKNAVVIVDMVIPTIIIFIIKRVGYELDKKELQLNKDERELLEQPLQDCLNSIKFNLDNPFNMLAVVLGIVYGTKIMDKWDEISKKKKTDINTIEAIQQSSELNNEQKFEGEYNILVSDTMKKRRKGRVDSRVWIAKNESANIKALMTKYNINDEKYLSQDEETYK